VKRQGVRDVENDLVIEEMLRYVAALVWQISHWLDLAVME